MSSTIFMLWLAAKGTLALLNAMLARCAPH